MVAFCITSPLKANLYIVPPHSEINYYGISLILSIRPFTYDVHLEGINLLLVLLSPQMYPHSSSGILLKHIMAINRLAAMVV